MIEVWIFLPFLTRVWFIWRSFWRWGWKYWPLSLLKILRTL